VPRSEKKNGSKSYVPKRGDFIWLDFDPRVGHEQIRHRPALVVSPESYNKVTGLALVCPITSKIKKFPFEVEIPAGLKPTGAVLSDHLKSVDWTVRRAEFIDTAPASVLEEVLAKLSALIFDS